MADKDKTPSAIDHAAAEKAFHALRPRLLQIPPDNFASISADVQKSAIAAAAVARWISDPHVRARFASLPKKEFDQGYVDDLESIALAAIHASIELLSANAGTSEAKLPLALVQSATQVKQRMISLVDYHFGDDPEDGPEVASIKQGTGYADLASDLFRLAKLYKKHHAIVALDPKNYVASDMTDAKRYAHQIVEALGEAKNQDAKTWTDLVARAWTLLVEAYGEVSAAGKWLFRKEDPEAKFPSLYAAGRASAGRPRKAKPQDEGPGTGEPPAAPA